MARDEQNEAMDDFMRSLMLEY